MIKKLYYLLLLCTLNLIASTAEPAPINDGFEILARHKVIAEFDGISHKRCMGRTALCPDRCGHSGSIATFSVKHYLEYEKPGKYGDKQAKKFYIRLTGTSDAKLSDEQHKLIKTLKKGDQVQLAWNHEYGTKNRSSYPARPVTQLEKVTAAEVKALLAEKKAVAEKVNKEISAATALRIQLTLAAEEISFQGACAKITIYEYHPMIADKAADEFASLVLKNLKHAKGKASVLKLSLGDKKKLKGDRKYYVTATIFASEKMEVQKRLFFLDGFNKVQLPGKFAGMLKSLRK